jgi:hypothetical protein
VGKLLLPGRSPNRAEPFLALYEYRPSILRLNKGVPMTENEIAILIRPEDRVISSMYDATVSNQQEGRIRKILGLTGGALPKADIKWLRKYYDYLAAALDFPFDAQYVEDNSGCQVISSSGTVVSLIDLGSDPSIEQRGLVCRAWKGQQQVVDVPLVDLEVGDESPNYQLLEDYWFWFWNWRFDPRI